MQLQNGTKQLNGGHSCSEDVINRDTGKKELLMIT